MMSTPPYSRRPTMRSAAAKDDNYAFGDQRPRVEREQLSVGVLLRSFNRRAGDLVLVLRVGQDTASQCASAGAAASDLDGHPLIRVQALDGADAVRTLHRGSPGGAPPSEL